MSPLAPFVQRLLKPHVATKGRPLSLSSSQRIVANFFSLSNSNDQDVKSTGSCDVLTKGEIIEKIAEDHKLTKAQSSRIFSNIFDTIVEVSGWMSGTLSENVLSIVTRYD